MKSGILEFTGSFDSDEYDKKSSSQWLFRSSYSSDCLKVNLPIAVNPKLRVLDLRTLTKDGSQAILLTNFDGLFRTLDGGQNWEDVDFGEASFIQGNKLKIIVTKSPPYVYIFVDRNQTFSE